MSRTSRRSCICEEKSAVYAAYEVEDIMHIRHFFVLVCELQL
jgi:hypothetical protein